MTVFVQRTVVDLYGKLHSNASHYFAAGVVGRFTADIRNLSALNFKWNFWKSKNRD